MYQYLCSSYADFKLIAAQFTSGHVFFFDGTATPTPLFKIWAMASGFPSILVLLAARPSTFATDFPSAVQLSQPLSTGEA